MQRKVWLRSRSRWNGTYRRESVTESIRKASARVANSLPGASPALDSRLAGNSPSRLHNPVTLPYRLARQLRGGSVQGG